METLHVKFDPLVIIHSDHGHELRHIEHLLHSMEHRIMTRIKDYGDKQGTYNAQNSAKLDAVMQSITGIAGDVQGLNDKITQLQNSPGQVSPEDGETINQLEIQGAALVDKFTGVVDALKALDDSTPPVTG